MIRPDVLDFVALRDHRVRLTNVLLSSKLGSKGVKPMSVKSSISLTAQQDAFARSLVESGRYSSMSSVLQQGLELLRQKTETETVETAALGELVQRRLNGPMISATEMESRVAAMIERKRLVVRVDS
jgi:antitoxin ParD1/3/4